MTGQAAGFGPAARRLSGLCAQLLGWRPEEFWAATPAELAAIFTPDAGPAPAPLGRDELAKLMEREEHG